MTFTISSLVTPPAQFDVGEKIVDRQRCVRARRRDSFCLRLVFALMIVFVGGTTVASTPVSAQTRFLWPDSRFDITKYKHIEMCAGVIGRVRDSVDALYSTYFDTLHYSVYNKTTPIAASIITAAQRCLAPFSVDQVSLDIVRVMMPVYLVANNDSAAKLLLDRQIQAIPADSVRHRMAIIDSGLWRYNASRPPRARLSVELYSWFEKSGMVVPTRDRIMAAGMVAATARESRDTALSRAGVNNLANLAKAMTNAEWEDGNLGGAVSAMIFWGIRWLHTQELEVELATSTDAFKTKIHRLFTELVGKPPSETLWTDVGMIGTPAKSPVCDFWFPAGAEKHTYPQPGVVTLFMGVDSEIGIRMKASAIARRLKIANPELEIILLAKTGGWFKTLEPPPPAYEAVLIDSMFRKIHEVPAIVGVTNTTFWRLPGYDRRRVNDITVNQENGYLGSGSVRLVDKEGKLVTLTSLGGDEQALEGLIPVLIKRPWVKP